MTSAAPVPAVSRRWLLLGPVLLAFGLWLVLGIWPGLLTTIGISSYDRLFLDSYAIVAALDALRAGIDPHPFNPLDAMLRPHVYSDWWLALRWLGLTREHNFLLGLSWVGAFGLTAWVTMRPRTLGESWWLAVLLTGPAVLLAVNRANNDLVVFVLLAGCGLAARPGRGWIAAALVCLWLATGLKYYPAIAVAAFLWIRPVRQMPALLLAAMVVAGLAMASVWDEISRGRFLIGNGVYTMGAPMLSRDLGWADKDAVLPSLALLAGGALALAAGGLTAGMARRGQPQERMLAALGAAVVLACFMAGMNYSYRWIFILWPAFWLWRQAGEAALPARERWTARFAVASIALALWGDGLFCAAINLFNPVNTHAWMEHTKLVWRLWNQPLQWLLMMMLAGWCLEGAWCTVREWWSLRHEA